jgi:hypothetical protein
MVKAKIALMAAAAVALICCKHDGAAMGTEPGSQHKPRVTSPAIAELLAAVPGSAVALGFIDMDDTPWSLLTGGILLPLDEDIRKTLDKDLRDYVNRYLGLDLSKLQYAVGFVSGPQAHGAVLLKTIGGALKRAGASEYEGGKMWVVDPHERVSLAIKGDVVVLGDDESVRQVLETLGGKRKAVTVDNQALVDWLRTESNGAVLAFAAIKPKNLPLPPQVAGLERVAVRVGASGMAAVVDGDDATISALQSLSDQAFAKMLAEVEKPRLAALAGEVPPAKGAVAIISAAYAKSYAAKLKPQRSGNRLSVSLERAGADATAVIAVIGILSAVAIPSFMDYMKRSKNEQAQ